MTELILALFTICLAGFGLYRAGKDARDDEMQGDIFRKTTERKAKRDEIDERVRNSADRDSLREKYTRD